MATHVQSQRTVLVDRSPRGQAPRIRTDALKNAAGHKVVLTAPSAKGIYVSPAARATLPGRAMNLLSGRTAARRAAAIAFVADLRALVDAAGDSMSHATRDAIGESLTSITHQLHQNRFKSSIDMETARGLLEQVEQHRQQQALAPLADWFRKEAPGFFDSDTVRRPSDAAQGAAFTPEEIEACKKMVPSFSELPDGAGHWQSMSSADFALVQSFARKWLASTRATTASVAHSPEERAATAWAIGVLATTNDPAARLAPEPSTRLKVMDASPEGVAVNRKTYSFKSLLAEGRQGSVALHEERAGKTVVVKKVGSGTDDQHNESATLAEATAHLQARGPAKQRSPNVLGIKGTARLGGDSLLVLEHAKHGDALQLVSKLTAHFGAPSLGSQGESARLLAFADMVKGVQQAHANGVMHLDIKHENFFIDESFNLRLGDFGTAQPVLAGIMASPTQTPDFSPPELRPNQGKERLITYKADMWSLGIVLYHMFSPRSSAEADPLKQRAETLPFQYGEQAYVGYDAIDDFAAAATAERYRRLNLVPQNPIHKLIVELLDPDPAQRPSANDLLAKPALAPFATPTTRTESDKVVLARQALQAALTTDPPAAPPAAAVDVQRRNGWVPGQVPLRVLATS